MEKFNVQQFITEIQNRPAIWDPSCDEYGHRDTRKQCWDQITDVFAEKEMSTAEKRILTLDLQKRWKNIRTCYSRELKRQKQLQAGVPMEDRKSEYLYYKQLQFLQRGIRDTESPEMPEDFFEEQNIDLEEPPRKLIKLETREDYDPFRSIYPEQRSIDHGLPSTSSALTGVVEDKLFLLSLLSTLNGLPSRKKMATKIKILSLLHEATDYDD